MWNVRILLAVSIVASAFALPGVLAADDCTHYTQPSIPVGASHYLWVANGILTPYVELWQESNGVPGLQRVGSSCQTGVSPPRDSCIVHSVQAQIPSCVMAYPGPAV